MNPQEQEHTPFFELPPAQSSEQKDQALPEQQRSSSTEKQSSIAIEHGIPQQPAPPSVAPPAPQQDLTGQSAAQDQGGQQAAQPTSAIAGWTPQIADDSDLIEKEWVTKAKEIVAQTAHDPHLQNREMNKFKADYLKKRYNKEIKLGEDT